MILALDVSEVQRDNTENPVFGVLMEMKMSGGVVSFVAIADGTVSMYFSNGGGMLGLGGHEGPRRVAKEWLDVAPSFISDFQKTQEYPLPTVGCIRFYLLTVDGVLTAEVKEDDLTSGRHALSPLLYKGNDLITQIRLIDEKRNSQ